MIPVELRFIFLSLDCIHLEYLNKTEVECGKIRKSGKGTLQNREIFMRWCYPVVFLLICLLLSLLSCGNSLDKRVQSHYCLSGYHLEEGLCVPNDSGLDGDSDDASVPLDGDSHISDGDPREESLGDMDDVQAVDGDGEGNEKERDIYESDKGWPRLTIAAPGALAVGQISGLRAWFDMGLGDLPVDVSHEVGWTSFNPAAAQVDSEQATISGLSIGEALVRAKYAGHWSDPSLVKIKGRSLVEVRGIWVNRWAFTSAADVDAIIEKAHTHNFNQIYFQVRGVFDAYYASKLEPWAKRLTGKLGKDPSWDPLQYAIEKAHERGMELHAWINVFTLWDGSTRPSESEPRHMYLQHPEWVMQDENHHPMPLGSGYVWGSPGNVGLREHNAAVVRDIVSRYQVDGIHLDRVRYPAANYSHDPASEEAYQLALANKPALSYAQWEREQVTDQVARIYRECESRSPKVVLSAAVAGIYQDYWDWGSVTEGYHHWLQDWISWDEQEIIDVLIPMVYWRCTENYGAWTDFCALVDSHAQKVTKRFLYIGSDLNYYGDAEKRSGSRRRGHETWSQISKQIEHTRSVETRGWVLYDYGVLNTVGYWDELLEGPFALPADVPFLWWK